MADLDFLESVSDWLKEEPLDLYTPSTLEYEPVASDSIVTYQDEQECLGELNFLHQGTVSNLDVATLSDAQSLVIKEEEDVKPVIDGMRGDCTETQSFIHSLQNDKICDDQDHYSSDSSVDIETVPTSAAKFNGLSVSSGKIALWEDCTSVSVGLNMTLGLGEEGAELVEVDGNVSKNRLERVDSSLQRDSCGQSAETSQTKLRSRKNKVSKIHLQRVGRIYSDSESDTFDHKGSQYSSKEHPDKRVRKKRTLKGKSPKNTAGSSITSRDQNDKLSGKICVYDEGEIFKSAPENLDVGVLQEGVCKSVKTGCHSQGALGESDLVCPLCQQHFGYASTLCQHLAIHTKCQSAGADNNAVPVSVVGKEQGKACSKGKNAGQRNTPRQKGHKGLAGSEQSSSVPATALIGPDPMDASPDNAAASYPEIIKALQAAPVDASLVRAPGQGCLPLALTSATEGTEYSGIPKQPVVLRVPQIKTTKQHPKQSGKRGLKKHRQSHRVGSQGTKSGGHSTLSCHTKLGSEPTESDNTLLALPDGAQPMGEESTTLIVPQGEGEHGPIKVTIKRRYMVVTAEPTQGSKDVGDKKVDKSSDIGLHETTSEHLSDNEDVSVESGGEEGRSAGDGEFSEGEGCFTDSRKPGAGAHYDMNSGTSSQSAHSDLAALHPNLKVMLSDVCKTPMYQSLTAGGVVKVGSPEDKVNCAGSTPSVGRIGNTCMGGSAGSTGAGLRQKQEEEACQGEPKVSGWVPRPGDEEDPVDTKHAVKIKGLVLVPQASAKKRSARKSASRLKWAVPEVPAGAPGQSNGAPQNKDTISLKTSPQSRTFTTHTSSSAESKKRAKKRRKRISPSSEGESKWKTKAEVVGQTLERKSSTDVREPKRRQAKSKVSPVKDKFQLPKRRSREKVLKKEKGEVDEVGGDADSGIWTESEGSPRKEEGESGGVGKAAGSGSGTGGTGKQVLQTSTGKLMSITELWDHVTAHLASRSRLEPATCPMCSKSFSFPSALKRHILMHTGERAHKCPKCPKAFARMPHLEAHLRTHTGERPYVCNKCPAAFAQHSNLKVHMRVHTGARPFGCPECGVRFRRQDAYSQHLLTHHSGVKPFTCAECGAAFACPRYLKDHLRTHATTRPYKCPLCSAAFVCNKYLVLHTRAIHTNYRPFRCSKCPARFTQSGKLREHFRVHTGERPYNCSTCNAAFTRSGHLRRHLRVHTGERPYACDNCEARFSQYTHLKRHRDTVHKPS